MVWSRCLSLLDIRVGHPFYSQELRRGTLGHWFASWLSETSAYAVRFPRCSAHFLFATLRLCQFTRALLILLGVLNYQVRHWLFFHILNWFYESRCLWLWLLGAHKERILLIHTIVRLLPCKKFLDLDELSIITVVFALSLGSQGWVEQPGDVKPMGCVLLLTLDNLSI